MRRTLLLALICISFGAAAAQFRHAIFLHHSVGNCFWDRSRVSNLTPPTTLPKEVTTYNSIRGYTGSSAVSMDEVYFPDPPEVNDNNWYRWDNIFNGRDAYGYTMDSYYSSYPVIVIKTCYLATQFMSVVDSIESYKTEWRHILTVMKNHPNNFFCIWTSYPAATDGHAQRDAWSNTFCLWAKDTLGAGKDSFGPLPPNVYVFDVFHKLASSVDGYCDSVYGSWNEGPGGDHPSNLAVGLIDSAFVREMFDAAIAYEHPLSPAAATLPATSVQTSGAELNGTVNPNGISTSYHFDYGLTTAYGTSTSTQSAGSASGTTAVSATVGGLSSGTLYHFRLAATYSGGTAYGNDASFTTASNQAPPSVTTSAASLISANGAQLNGSVNPNGSATTYHFDYGTTTGYGTSTAGANAGSGSSATAVSAALTALSPGTLYHFRLVGANSGGTASGSDATFTTTAATGPPTVRTTGSNGVSATGAQLDGTVNPNGLATTYHFDYGTTTAYGSSTSAQNGGSGTSSIAVNTFVSGLSPVTLYHFRLVAANSGGTTNGNDTTLTTGTLTSTPPLVTTLAATNITGTGMQLNGSVNPNGASTDYQFVYGPTTAYGTVTPLQNAGSGSSTTGVSTIVAGLTPSTLYHYRLVASNSGGSASGNDTSAITGAAPVPPPAVVTSPIASATSTGAQLNGSVNPNGFNTTCYFEYGLTASYGVTTPVRNVGAGLSLLPVSATVGGLSAGTLYHYRLTAQNSGGSAYGSDTTFATVPLVPRVAVLLQNYPNPFNPTTTIKYGIPRRAFVTLKVFNTLGQPIATLVSGEQDAGYYEAVFDGSNLASGTYFCRLEAGDDLEMRRIVLVH